MAKEFLKGEWSIENILFWDDVEKLKQMEDVPAIREECQRIFEVYFTKGSSLELNLRTDISETVATLMQHDEPCPYIFVEAQEAIYQLLRADSFFRFKRFLKLNQYVI